MELPSLEPHVLLVIPPEVTTILQVLVSDGHNFPGASFFSFICSGPGKVTGPAENKARQPKV